MQRVTTAIAVVNGIAFIIVAIITNNGAKELTRLSHILKPEIVYDTVFVKPPFVPRCPECGRVLNPNDKGLAKCCYFYLIVGEDIYKVDKETKKEN